MWLQVDQLRLLGNLPGDLLSKQALRKLQELERRFPDFRTDMGQPSITGGTVHAPIPQSAQAKMSCEDWRKAILEYDDSTDWDAPRSHLGGGIVELSREFAKFVKEDPE